MGKDVDFNNRDRLIQLGIAISTLRKMRGLSQEQLAEKAKVSRSLISCIEAPGMAKSFSLDVFFSIADALDVELILVTADGGVLYTYEGFTPGTSGVYNYSLVVDKGEQHG